jgi:hypothetical protein
MAAASHPANDSGRQLLRHTVSTLAYRAGKTLRDVPESFATFAATESCRRPAQILAHMGDLFDWALSIAQGKQAWHDSAPLPWSQEVERLFKTLEAFDGYLASDAPLAAPQRNYSRVRLQTRLRTRGKSQSCADWLAARFVVRTITARKLLLDGLAMIRPRRHRNSDSGATARITCRMNACRVSSP